MELLIVKSLETREDEKNVFVEGYASAAVEDLDGEIISEEALQKVAKELTEEPYNKVFLDHAPMKFNANFEEKLPIGRIIEAEAKEVEGKLKLWMKLVLNKAHPYFEVVYKSIKEGFLNAFSIGFQVLQRKGRVITDLKVLEVSLVGIPANPEAVVEEVYEKMFGELEIRGVVPTHPWKYGKDEQSGWTKPNLSDFTSSSWEELDDEEKKNIAGHFAYAPKNPPDRYTDLKFPHHNPTKHPKPHAVNLGGVVAGFVRLSVARLPDNDKRKIYGHLAAHYRNDFGREPPDYKSVIDAGAVLKALHIDEEVFLKAIGPDVKSDAATEHSALKSLNYSKENMDEFEKRIKELEATNRELSEKVKELEAKISELESENARLKEENERLGNEVKQYVEREKAELIEKIKVLTDEVNEEELKVKDVVDLKEYYLTLLETRVIKAKSLPLKVKVGGEDSDEVSFKGVF
ncbi:Phage head maturation protease [Archaeoglobus sulfaticallidus PM70-1]|uniref:Phage head maturation protease n=1 Tax=Archaeoglobus sulfaticallidus PM70-1 TaxID=387631 RepID=N0BML6_9EURY|nr:HK97 family phage prohead protease [Archaeoglobus sulfaticallidus]AGK61495.1 Phage head maturation protease [Archaeoglobus sulfaticallidus PM70-1]